MRLPRSDLRLESRCVIDATVKTLTFEDAYLDFSHVQPTPFLGNVVKLESVEICSGFFWREELVEASGLVRIEMVNHNPDALRIRVVDIRKFDHPVDPFGGASPFRCLDGDPPSQRFCSKMEPLFAVAFVSMIDTSDRSRFGRERVAFVATECLAGLVEADDGTLLVVGFVIEVENILHVIDEISVLFGWNLLVAGEMRFQGVFLDAV
jgi:hypothetical protein